MTRHISFANLQRGLNRHPAGGSIAIISSLDKSGAGRTYIYPEVFPAFEQDDDQVIDDMAKTMKYWKEYV